jgi:hypothetical protein
MIHLPEQSYYTVHDRSIWYLLTMSKMVVGAEKDIPCRYDLLVVIEGRGAQLCAPTIDFASQICELKKMRGFDSNVGFRG